MATTAGKSGTTTLRWVCVTAWTARRRGKDRGKDHLARCDLGRLEVSRLLRIRALQTVLAMASTVMGALMAIMPWVESSW